MEKRINENVTTDEPIIKEGLVTLLLALSGIIVVMNTMMFNLAVPQVTEELQLSQTASSWIITSYSIVLAVTTLAYTRLSDFLPLRTLLIGGLTCLGIASFVGFFSSNYIILIICRVFQSAGAGAVLGLSILLISRYVPPSRRGRALAFIYSSLAFGVGLGPVLGGMITYYLGWNYLFLITAFVLLLLPFLYLHIPGEARSNGVFDYYGAVFVATSFASFLLFITSYSIIALACSVVLFLLFWWRIHRTEHPFVQPSLIRNKRFLTITSVIITAHICNFGLLFLLPQLLIYQFGLTEAQAGFIIFPGALITMILSRPIGAIVDRFGNKPVLQYTPWLFLAAIVMFALFAHISSLIIMSVYVLVSISISALSTSVTNEVTITIPPEERSAGVGILSMLQTLSGALSVALISSGLAMQKHLDLSFAYANIFWGMTVVMGLCVLCSFLYLYSKEKQRMQSL